MSKMIKCNSCNADIAKSAKSCPHCGAKNKKPFFKRVSTWIILAIVVIGIGAVSGGADSPSVTPAQNEPVVIEYQQTTVGTMLECLNKNALKAENDYSDQYLEITGYINNIDSDGSYFSMVSSKNAFELTNVMCYIQNEEQLNTLMEMSVGNKITVRGQVTNIGEVLGYSVKLIEIIV